MPSNTTEYASNYYQTVVKPKRQKAQKKKNAEIKKKFSGEITVKRICPICNKEWEETIVWNSNRKPSPKKQCKECILVKQKEYTNKPEVRAKINARLRSNYANSEELRKRKRANTYKWRNNILANEETAVPYREKEKARAKEYNEKKKQSN